MASPRGVTRHFLWLALRVALTRFAPCNFAVAAGAASLAKLCCSRPGRNPTVLRTSGHRSFHSLCSPVPSAYSAGTPFCSSSNKIGLQQTGISFLKGLLQTVLGLRLLPFALRNSYPLQKGNPCLLPSNHWDRRVKWRPHGKSCPPSWRPPSGQPALRFGCAILPPQLALLPWQNCRTPVLACARAAFSAPVETKKGLISNESIPDLFWRPHGECCSRPGRNPTVLRTSGHRSFHSLCSLGPPWASRTNP